MSIVSEMPKAKEAGEMTLRQIRQELGRLRKGERVEAEELSRLHDRLRLILVKLARLGAKGGKFAQVQASDELLELYRQTRWA